MGVLPVARPSTAWLPSRRRSLIISAIRLAIVLAISSYSTMTTGTRSLDEAMDKDYIIAPRRECLSARRAVDLDANWLGSILKEGALSLISFLARSYSGELQCRTFVVFFVRRDLDEPWGSIASAHP